VVVCEVQVGLLLTSADKSPLPKEWGSFGHLEWFPIGNLPFDPRGEVSLHVVPASHSLILNKQTPLYHKVDVQSLLFFKKFPEPANATSWPSGQRTRMDFDSKNNVVRLTKLFTMFENPQPKANTVPSINSPYSLGMNYNCLSLRRCKRLQSSLFHAPT
jgi:hypothetical protein